jgi:hypothetical protein
MNFDDLTKALRANEIDIAAAHLAAFGRVEAGILRGFAETYHHAAAQRLAPTWAQMANLDRATLESIAENYEWAAGEIERLARAVA